MAKPVLSAKHFHNEEAAYAYVEKRVWPQGPVCPKCGETARLGKLAGKSTRIGTYKCYACRKPFTVKVGTIFEDSKVPMYLWLQAMHFMCSGKKGISSNQLSRVLGVQLNTAWFMSHRIREAMRSGALAVPMGTGGGIVESDETFIGTKKGVVKGGGGFRHKMKVHSLVERGGELRSVVVENVTRKEVETIIAANVSREATLMTDTAPYYRKKGFPVADHQLVNHHAGEYVVGQAHTNTLEGYYSVFKRGMKGVYQHCAEKHLHRYLAEFDFRYNQRVALGVNDTMRAERALEGIKGKRLTYRLA